MAAIGGSELDESGGTRLSSPVRVSATISQAPLATQIPAATACRAWGRDVWEGMAGMAGMAEES